MPFCWTLLAARYDAGKTAPVIRSSYLQGVSSVSLDVLDKFSTCRRVIAPIPIAAATSMMPLFLQRLAMRFSRKSGDPASVFFVKNVTPSEKLLAPSGPNLNPVAGQQLDVTSMHLQRSGCVGQLLDGVPLISVKELNWQSTCFTGAPNVTGLEMVRWRTPLFRHWRHSLHTRVCRTRVA